jgi:uncharacterized membrane-anchored protein
MPAKAIKVKFSVVNYFVTEGEGRVLERTKPDETVSIRLGVDRHGNATIKAMLIKVRYAGRIK